jgi:hypothetical protein
MSEDLLDYCTAPMPYIMGVHSSLIDRVLREPLESHVFVDIDADTGRSPALVHSFAHLTPVLSPFWLFQTSSSPSSFELISRARSIPAVTNPEADYQLIPLDLVGHIRAAVNKAKKDKAARGDQLATSCVRFFAECIGDFHKFSKPRAPRARRQSEAADVVDSPILDEDKFVSAKKKEHHDFYKELVQMQAPTQFFDQRFDAIARGAEVCPRIHFRRRQGGGCVCVCVSVCVCARKGDHRLKASLTDLIVTHVSRGYDGVARAADKRRVFKSSCPERSQAGASEFTPWFEPAAATADHRKS